MNEDKEFQKKVQQAVDSYLLRKDKQQFMVEQIKDVLEREQLIEQVQKLLVELITKLTERFITNMKKQVENEIQKLRESIRATHQRSYSTVDKEKVEDLVQRTLNKHEIQINMLLEHQVQRKSLPSEIINEKCDINVQKEFETLKNELQEQIKTFSKNYNQKQFTIMEILNDLTVKMDKIDEKVQQQQKVVNSDKKKK